MYKVYMNIKYEVGITIPGMDKDGNKDTSKNPLIWRNEDSYSFGEPPSSINKWDKYNIQKYYVVGKSYYEIEESNSNVFTTVTSNTGIVYCYKVNDNDTDIYIYDLLKSEDEFSFVDLRMSGNDLDQITKEVNVLNYKYFYTYKDEDGKLYCENKALTKENDKYIYSLPTDFYYTDTNIQESDDRGLFSITEGPTYNQKYFTFNRKQYFYIKVSNPGNPIIVSAIDDNLIYCGNNIYYVPYDVEKKYVTFQFYGTDDSFVEVL